MSYTEHPKFKPEWESCEFVYLDRTWKEIEWIYVNPDANDAPQFVSEICSFDDFCNCVHDALESCGEFSEYYEAHHREYLKDRHSKFFDDMCDFLENNEPDFTFDTSYATHTWSVMTVFSEVYSILRGVRE